MTKLRVVLRSFVNAPKNCIFTDVAVLFRPFLDEGDRQHCQAPLLTMIGGTSYKFQQMSPLIEETLTDISSPQSQNT